MAEITMAEVNQFTWKHKEIVTMMVKEAGIHEGRWWLMVNFGMGPGNFGPAEDQVAPGMAVVLASIGIQREIPGQKAPSALVVDAAQVNPAPKTDKPPTSRSRQRAKS